MHIWNLLLSKYIQDCALRRVDQPRLCHGWVWISAWVSLVQFQHFNHYNTTFDLQCKISSHAYLKNCVLFFVLRTVPSCMLPRDLKSLCFPVKPDEAWIHTTIYLSYQPGFQSNSAWVQCHFLEGKHMQTQIANKPPSSLQELSFSRLGEWSNRNQLWMLSTLGVHFHESLKKTQPT